VLEGLRRCGIALQRRSEYASVRGDAPTATASYLRRVWKDDCSPVSGWHYQGKWITSCDVRSVTHSVITCVEISCDDFYSYCVVCPSSDLSPRQSQIKVSCGSTRMMYAGSKLNFGQRLCATDKPSSAISFSKDTLLVLFV
jgi:hypothetical protein